MAIGSILRIINKIRAVMLRTRIARPAPSTAIGGVFQVIRVNEQKTCSFDQTTASVVCGAFYALIVLYSLQCPHGTATTVSFWSRAFTRRLRFIGHDPQTVRSNLA